MGSVATIYHEDMGVGSLQCTGALIRSISVDVISPTETQPLSILPSFSCQAGKWTLHHCVNCSTCMQVKRAMMQKALAFSGTFRKLKIAALFEGVFIFRFDT